MYQTPFTERQSWVQKNKGKYLIGKIFILKKAINNKIVRCNNRSEILKKFIEEFLVYNDKNLENQLISAIKYVNTFHNFFLLYFQKNKKLLIEVIESNLDG